MLFYIWGFFFCYSNYLGSFCQGLWSKNNSNRLLINLLRNGPQFLVRRRACASVVGLGRMKFNAEEVVMKSTTLLLLVGLFMFNEPYFFHPFSKISFFSLHSALACLLTLQIFEIIWWWTFEWSNQLFCIDFHEFNLIFIKKWTYVSK